MRMAHAMIRRSFIIAFAGIWAAQAAAEPPAPPRAEFVQKLATAIQRAAQEDCQSALPLLNDGIGDRDFPALREQARALVYESAAICTMRLGEMATAYRYARNATQSDKATTELWRLRLAMEVDGDRHMDIVATIEAMSMRNPEALNAMPLPIIYSAQSLLDRLPDKSVRSRFLKILAAPGYQPDEALKTGDYFKKQYAAILAERGDKQGATALIARISDPSELISISVDKRLKAFMPAGFDERAATERWLARARDVAASQGASLSAVLEIVETLRDLGRPEEALATLKAIPIDGKNEQSFADINDYRNWWWDELGTTYIMLGRYDETVAAYQGGIAAKEHGGMNVSQTINLAYAHLRFNQPGKVLATIGAFENAKYNATPYAEMLIRVARGCAQAALGKPALAKPEIAYVEAHDQDSPTSLINLLLCLDDMDGAAAAMIRRLDDPDRGPDALLALSDYDKDPQARLPALPFTAKLPALKARPDVAAAIERAGGTRRFRLAQTP